MNRHIINTAKGMFFCLFLFGMFSLIALLFTQAKADVDISSIQRMTLVSFGQYEQDDDTGNGSESIVWVVLDNDGKNIWLISKDILELRAYDDKGSDNWEKSTLRKWLNGEFYNTAFSATEKQAIVKTKNANESHLLRGRVITKHNTQDNVFLLSKNEAPKYLGQYVRNNPMYQYSFSVCTNYAIRRRYGEINEKDLGKGRYAWWLRTGFNEGGAYVCANKEHTSFKASTSRSDFVYCGVRPVIIINVKKATSLLSIISSP